MAVSPRDFQRHTIVIEGKGTDFFSDYQRLPRKYNIDYQLININQLSPF